MATSVSGQTLLSVREVSERLGVSTKTVYAMLKRGQLRSRVVGKRHLVPESSLARLALASEVLQGELPPEGLAGNVGGPIRDGSPEFLVLVADERGDVVRVAAFDGEHDAGDEFDARTADLADRVDHSVGLYRLRRWSTGAEAPGREGA